MKTINATMANDHGRRMGLRSPLLVRSGRSIRAAINRAGPRIMTQSSDHFGIKESTAKYHKKYHSGRGEAATMVGSDGFPSSGGPTITASDDCDNQQGCEDDIAPSRIRPKWLSIASEQRAVPGAISFRIDRAAGLRRLRDSIVQDEIKMESDQKENERRNEKDMRCKEAAQGSA